MLFNTLDFAVFLPVVFGIYWLLSGRLYWQNLCIVISSLVFYGWWDWRFLFLLIFSTLVDYLVGIKLNSKADDAVRKYWLWLSIGVNLGLLGFFKYQHFFVDNFVTAFRLFGFTLDVRALQYVLPVGISFYTFQTMSYSIDVYRRKLLPAENFFSFLAYVSFFPQLVAGPIERATHLLPQFEKERTFSYSLAAQGMRQILWGLFKKMVIADNCAALADPIFAEYMQLPGSTLLLGAFFFAIQIYGDFSGYSDIAIGTARLFGFELMQNFAFPYFSRDVAEFWRRWHISLTSWFKDYVYIPLGGSRVNRAHIIRNVLVVFLLSGFWHGPNWQYIAWGGWHALLFVPLIWNGNHRQYMAPVASGKWMPSLRETMQVLSTFLLVCIGWVFFRSVTLSNAFDYLRIIASPSLLEFPKLEKEAAAYTQIILIVLFFAVEWWGREGQFALARLQTWPGTFRRWAVYLLLVSLIGLFMKSEDVPFIYFQF